MSRINTIIFDVGNVLVDFDWNGFLKRLFPNHDEKFFSRINEAVWGDGRWDSLDAGDDPDEVFAKIYAHAPEYESELRTITSRFGEALRKRPETPEWLKSLKSRGYKLLYLSNYAQYVMDMNPEVLDCIPLLDGGIFSCYVRMIKPNREIYECLAKKYNLNPSECVFIDDLEKNVRAGRDFGFNGIQFITLKQVKEDLEKILKQE